MKFIFFIVLCLIISLPFFYFWQGIYLPKNSNLEQEKIFTIKSGEGAREIAQNLERQNLIKNDFFFKLYLLKKRKVEELQAGTYLLSPLMTIPEIAAKFTEGNILTYKITIPEGFNTYEIEKSFSGILGRDITLSNFKIKDFQNEFEILKKINPEKSLQGFLFPDTYEFPYDITKKDIIRMMLSRLEEKLSKNLREEIIRQGKSIFEIINVAALIEEEVKIFRDRKLVSGILWRRMKINMPLQIDATIVYILQKKDLLPEQGWTFEEMLKQVGLARKIDSPYNTYIYRGLPPGPITNPGLESILASVYPEDSQYWYYLSTPDSKTIFSKTLKEHNTAKAKYLR